MRAVLVALVLGFIMAPAATIAQDAVTYSDEQIDLFVETALVVDPIYLSWMDRIEATEDAAQRDELVKQANAEILAAIAKIEGMNVDLYNAIALASEDDPALRARIDAMADAKRSAKDVLSTPVD